MPGVVGRAELRPSNPLEDSTSCLRSPQGSRERESQWLLGVMVMVMVTRPTVVPYLATSGVAPAPCFARSRSAPTSLPLESSRVCRIYFLCVAGRVLCVPTTVRTRTRRRVLNCDPSRPSRKP